jgi:hypothetical protein
MENELENKSENKFEKTISQLSGSARRYRDCFELHLVLTVDNLRNCQQLQTLVDLAYHLGIISNSDKLLYTSQLNDFGEYCDFLN